ncbi:hypothetical protein DOY81_000895 [Sarcophaga bullata]|nr:hypothetical protein DOY81_000895 [Sarcophaga bullata]
MFPLNKEFHSIQLCYVQLLLLLSISDDLTEVTTTPPRSRPAVSDCLRLV